MVQPPDRPEVARAADPSTTPEQLADLAQHPDRAVQAQVARNPNTPPDLLLRLVEPLADEVLTNPAFDLLLLTEPNLWGRLPELALRACAQSPRCPNAMLDWALAHTCGPQVRARLILNLNLPRERRQTLFCQAAFLGSASPGLARAAELDEELVQLLVKVRAFQEQWKGESPQFEPAQPAVLSRGEFQALVRYGELGALLALEQPTCPSDWVQGCAASESVHLRAAAASHARLPREAMRKLAQDPGESVRVGLARNPGSTEPILRDLAHDPSLLVVCTLATHPGLPPDLAIQFSEHPSALVRRSLCAQLGLPAEAAERLRSDSDPDVRRSFETQQRLFRRG